MSKITIYVSDWCGNCKVIAPKIAEYARRNGLDFEKINVEACNTEKCKSIEYIPHVLIDGRIVSDKKLDQMIKDV